MRLNYLSHKTNQLFQLVKKCYESESVYASESDFEWSPKVLHG